MSELLAAHAFHAMRRGVFPALLLALSHATTANAGSDADIAAASSLVNQGRAAYTMGKVDAARMAFEKAYNLYPTPQTSYNLGLAEYATGRFVLAARHIATYLHQKARPTAEEKQALADAEKFVARVVFDVNVQGARLFVDDEDFGLTPFLFQPRYVSAGRHVIRATCDGFAETRQVLDVDAGQKQNVKIVLEPREPPSIASTEPPASDAGASPRATTSAPHDQVPPAPRTSTPIRLDTRTVLAGTGAALTLAAGILAVVEAARASSATSDAQALTARLGGRSACTSGPAPECAQLAELDSTRATAVDIGRGALVGVALLGSATAAVWFLWPRSTGVRIAPQVEQGAAGILVSGSIP